MKKYEERIIEYADILYPDKLREIKNPPLRLHKRKYRIIKQYWNCNCGFKN